MIKLLLKSFLLSLSLATAGSADGLNWDLINDDIGNPKQTKSMIYSHLTPPSNKGPNNEVLMTNFKKYDLGLGIGNEKGREFDTTTLVEVWRTALTSTTDGR